LKERAPARELRPEALFPLFAPVRGLPGVGPATERLLARLFDRPVPRRLDLATHLPVGLVDPSPLPSLAGCREGDAATLEVLVRRFRPGHGPKAPARVEGEAAGMPVDLAFFTRWGDALERKFQAGSRVLVHGRLGRFRDRWQMTHPEVLDPAKGGGAVPVYRLTEGLTQGRVRAAVRAALDKLPALPEWLDPGRLAGSRWPAWAEAVRALHEPLAEADLEPDTPARQRLAYDELLAGQLALAMVRRHRAGEPGRSLPGDGSLRARLVAALPFALTADQEAAFAEIARDLAAPAPMTRLLHGDVGSGKTLVALLAMLQAVESGAQAALMAPTEVLARQHAATLGALLLPLGLDVELLTGSEPPARRRQAVARLAEGRSRIAVGTHALFQPGVAFRALGLAVVDEQHRFGVAQRLALLAKGDATDLLLMSATPIPRTLLLAGYGDVTVSALREKPAGRKPVDTRVVRGDRLDELFGAVARAVDAGERIFWICPLIEGTEATDEAAALERFEDLRALFGGRVGLVHGRLAGPDKKAAVDAFARGETRLLVATTVIEVGVDVPEAGIIVVEQAERFGLAQLHQLRGRVGRGDKPAACVLVYKPPLGPIAHQRLKILRETDDGFRIAEEDLRLRGPGEALGTRQSGLPATRFADLAAHGELLEAAREDAEDALAADPALRGERGRALRVLLHLFERQDALPLLAAG
jgi:ATP-dependent DNA helicase RecG